MQTSCQKSFNCLLSQYFAYKALSRLKMPLKLCINKVQKLTKMNKKINNYFYDRRFHFLKKTGDILSATPPSNPPVASPSPGVIPLVHTRHRVQASKGDHPTLLQPLKIWILSPPRILTGVQEVDFQHGKVLKLASVKRCPVLTEASASCLMSQIR